MKKLLTLICLACLALQLCAQSADDSIIAFETDEAEFIAHDMTDDEAATADFNNNPLSHAGHNSAEQIAEDEIAAEATHYHGWVANVVQWYGHHVSYTAVGALMTVESSFIPFPSEIVIPPAVMVAADPATDNDMKIWLIVLVGTLGALLGAYINYFLSRWLGRPIIYKFVDSKWGHALRLSGEKMERAEKYFNEHGIVSTLVGRLIPVIRQLISIPAGLSKMNIGTFTFFTFLGAAIWNCVLALLGFLAVKAGGMDFIYKYSGLLSKVIIVLFAVAVLFFIVRSIIRKRKQSAQ
jgi:membrane protein DedA with SNARE-associated domain